MPEGLVIIIPGVLIYIMGLDMGDALARKWGIRLVAISLVIVAVKLFFHAGE